MEVTTLMPRPGVKVLSVISWQVHSNLISVAAFHICAGEEELVKFSFLCPNGTLFNQQYFVCDWWFNVDCAATEQFYSLNDELDTARQSSSLSAQGEYDSEAQKVSNKTLFWECVNYELHFKTQQNVFFRPTLRRQPSKEVVSEEEVVCVAPCHSWSRRRTSTTASPASPTARSTSPPSASRRCMGRLEARTGYFQVSRVEWQLIKILVTTDSRLGNNLEEILRFEAEIPPEYKRPSRDLQFDYVNTATARMEATKAVREAEDEANKLLETLVRLVSPDDIDQLYIIRWCDTCKPWSNLSSSLNFLSHTIHELKWGPDFLFSLYSLTLSSSSLISPFSHSMYKSSPHTGPHCSPLIPHSSTPLPQKPFLFLDCMNEDMNVWMISKQTVVKINLHKNVDFY